MGKIQQKNQAKTPGFEVKTNGFGDRHLATNNDPDQPPFIGGGESVFRESSVASPIVFSSSCIGLV